MRPRLRHTFYTAAVTAIMALVPTVAGAAPAPTHTGLHETQPARATTPTSSERIAPLAGPCGSSYVLLRSYPIYDDVFDKLSGYHEVYWSSAAKRNCLVTSHSSRYWGVSINTKAAIRPSGWSWPRCNSVGCDEGVYKYYAGPVYTPSGVDMSDRCIDITGFVGIQSHLQLQRIHCG